MTVDIPAPPWASLCPPRAPGAAFPPTDGTQLPPTLRGNSEHVYCTGCTRSVWVPHVVGNPVEAVIQMAGLVKAARSEPDAPAFTDHWGRPSFIYALRAALAVKVGVSVEPVDRLINHLRDHRDMALTPWLVVPGSQEFEQHIHRRLFRFAIQVSQRKTGTRWREWYSVDPAVLDYVERLRDPAFRRSEYTARLDSLRNGRAA